MRALELQSLDGPDGLVLIRRDDPVAGDAVVIDVRVAGVSFPDLLVTQGRYQAKPELPVVPGLEVSGIVREAPSGGRLRPGDRVWAALDGGGYSDVVVAPPERVFLLADELSFAEGAALPVNFLTAVFALRRRGRLTAGETVLVLGAAGGLGSAAVAVAARTTTRVIAVVSTEAKAEIALRAGATDVVVGPDWREQVLTLTDGCGADVVADPVGGEATAEAIRATAPEGRVLVLGFAAGEIPSVASNRLLFRNVSLVGAALGARAAEIPGLLGELAEEMDVLVRVGLRPIIGATFTLENGAAALHQIAARAAHAKLVLTMDSDGG